MDSKEKNYEVICSVDNTQFTFVLTEKSLSVILIIKLYKVSFGVG